MMDAADFCELAQVGENHMVMGRCACQTSLGLCVNHLYLTVVNYLDVPITLQEETSAAATSTYNEILVAELVHYNHTFNKSIHTCIKQ